jgi:dihydroorotate dehydrogenase (NAD+) catalytic subunit
MIELAPTHKLGLTLESPLIAGGGAFGFADEFAALVDFSRFGAFITNPITLQPRTPAEGTRVVPFAGGTLLHTGLPNPGLSAALREYEPRWRRMQRPVVVHLAATDAGAMSACVVKLERVESVSGIEIGFRDDESLSEAEAITRAAVQNAAQPVIVSLPFARAGAFARMAEKAGAQAITVTAPPRGAMFWEGEWVRGRMYGPSLLPHGLQIVREMRTLVSLPIIGAGGVHSQADVQAMLEAGAAAAIVDSAAWVAPDTAGR